MNILEQLKSQSTISREDIAKLLASIGKPGKKRPEKMDAVRELDLRNTQDIHIAETLSAYAEF